MKQIIFIISCITINCYSQNINFRKIILKSNLIFESSSFTRNSEFLNDFSKETFLIINKVDEIFKGETKLEKLKFKEYDEDYLANIDKHELIDIIRVIELDEVYHTIFFVLKKNNSVVVIENLGSKEYLKLRRQINTMSKIKKIKNYKKRYTKTLDWFIDNNLTPDSDFVDFYKQKNIIIDNVKYTDEQYDKAFKKFEKGAESLVSIVKKKYPEKVREYFLNKMEKIIKKRVLEYGDYYDFSKAVSHLENDFNDYDSVKYVLKNLLTNDAVSESDKIKIMKHLSKTATK